MNKINPGVLLLCSMIGIGNNRLEKVAFDRCYSIDLSFHYHRVAHLSLLRRFYSDVMPRVIHHIRSLTINLGQILKMKTYIENNWNGTLPNVTHLKKMLGSKQDKTGMPYTIGKLSIDPIFLKRN